MKTRGRKVEGKAGESAYATGGFGDWGFLTHLVTSGVSLPKREGLCL